MPPRNRPRSDTPAHSLDGQAIERLSEKSYHQQVSYDLPFGKDLQSEKGIFTAEQLLHMAREDGFTNLFDEPFANVEEMIYAAECDQAGIYTGEESLEDIREFIGVCTRCKLCEKRKSIVHTDGPETATFMFVGVAPFERDDETGRPFIGSEGRMLSGIIKAMGLDRDDVVVANVVRCRPPDDRSPTFREIMTCKQFLLHEIALIRPDVIVTLGPISTWVLLGGNPSFTECLGKFANLYGLKVMPTLDPIELIQDPSKKPELGRHIERLIEYLK